MPIAVNNLVWDITTGCNLACRYPCFAYKDGRRSSREVADAMIDWLLAQPGREKGIGFFGGEPLLEWDLMLWTMQQARRRAAGAGQSFTFSVTTNGTLLTEEMADALAENRCGVLLSIDGPPDLHDRMRVHPNGAGSYAAAERAARMLIDRLDRLPSLTARATWHPLAHQQGRRAAEHLVDMGFPDVALCPVDEADYEAAGEAYVQAERDLADWFIERTRQGRMPPLSFTTRYLRLIYDHRVLNRYQPQLTLCGAGKGMLGVGPDGGLYPCHRFAETPYLQRFRLGDVWSGPSAERDKFEFLNVYQFEFPFECTKCPAWPYCTPPCVGVNGDFTGSLFVTVRGHCVWSRIHLAECVRIHETLLECDYYHDMARKGFGSGGDRK